MAFRLTEYFSHEVLTTESDVDLIITRLMPKSLCLGWSCETGPSRNITTVMVFLKQGSDSHSEWLCSSCSDRNDCSMKPYVCFPAYFLAVSFSLPFVCSFISTPLLMLFSPPCQMGLPCGQVFRQETGSLRYRVHLPLYSNYQPHCVLPRVNTEATGCHLVVTRCSASRCCSAS